MLEPIARNVLGQSHHCLGKQLRISLSDLSLRHSLFQKWTQSRGALITGPDRKRSYRGVQVTDVVVIKEPTLVFLDKIQIGVQHLTKETLQNCSRCLRGDFQTAPELPCAFDHEIDEKI